MVLPATHYHTKGSNNHKLLSQLSILEENFGAIFVTATERLSEADSEMRFPAIDDLARGEAHRKALSIDYE